MSGLSLITPSGNQLTAPSRDDFLPRITLRDPAGLPLDTFTTYQRAIAESRQRLAAARLAPQDIPLGPSEWRLPHAPVPSRPDFTRAGNTTDRIRRNKKRTQADLVENTELRSNLVEALDVGTNYPYRDIRTTSTLDVDVNSREWALLCRTAEAVLGPLGTSLLPPIYPHPFVRTKSSLFPVTDVSTEMTSVGLASRQGASRDRPSGTLERERDGTVSTIAELTDVYEFPGFCSGCRRYSGWTFCYGCERDSAPHYHRDKTARTGGGFTYLKRDRPSNAISKNNPLNWRVMLDNGPYVFYDDLEVPSMEKYGIALSVERLSKDQDEGLFEIDKETGHSLNETEDILPRRPTTTTISVFSNQHVSTLDEESVDDEDEEVEEEEEEMEVDEIVERGATDSIGAFTTETDDMEPVSAETSPEESTSTGDQTKKKLYKVPAAFQLKQRDRKVMDSTSPFSTERNLNLPKYGNFDIKKSDQKLTEFEDFNRGDVSWKAPEAFQIQDRVESPHDFHLAARPQTSDTPMPAMPAAVKTPSLQPSPEQSPSLDKKEEKVQRKKQKKSKPVKESSPKRIESRAKSPESGVANLVPAPRPLPPIAEVPVVGPRPKQPRVAKEPVKREKKEVVKRVKTKPEDPSTTPLKPPPVEPEEIPDTPPPVFTPMEFREIELPFIPPSRVIEQPPLPTASPPSLPKMMAFIEPVKPLRELSTLHMETPPPMLEPPKQRRPPPAIKAKPKPRHLPRMPPSQVRAPGAHVSASEIKSIGDPLDFLAKYCIIHPDRLPHYVRVFSKAVGEQLYRYTDVPHPDGQFHDDSETATQPAAAAAEDTAEQQQMDVVPGELVDIEPVKATLTDKEKKRLRELTVVNVALKPENTTIGMNEGDQTVAKISYTLDTLMDKYEDLQRNLEIISDTRVRLLATLARKQFPELADPNYKPPKPKGKKKKKKKTEGAPAVNTAADGPDVSQPPPEADKVNRVAPKKLTDADIVSRLDEKQLKTLGYDMEMNRVNLEFQRLQEKLKTVDDRIEELEDEKKLVQLFARDEFQRMEATDSKPDNFLRRQSILYQKMHPIVNVEMNVSDVEEALREINGHLLTKNEMQYIFHILNIPGRKRIDVQLFSVIAALSEKVAQVDPFIRKLINKFDFEALNVKMDRAKELFCLLTEDEVDVPLGKIAARMLAVELAAGGVTDEHTQYVLSKFNRENKGIIDFMDYLTYIPLFIEIHDRILNAPLQLDRDW